MKTCGKWVYNCDCVWMCSSVFSRYCKSSLMPRVSPRIWLHKLHISSISMKDVSLLSPAFPSTVDSLLSWPLHSLSCSLPISESLSVPRTARYDWMAPSWTPNLLCAFAVEESRTASRLWAKPLAKVAHLCRPDDTLSLIWPWKKALYLSAGWI